MLAKLISLEYICIGLQMKYNKVGIMYINKRSILSGFSMQIAENQPSRRSGVMSLANIKGHMRFGHYVFGDNVEDMRNDWKTIGNDIRKAMNCYGK